MIDDKDLNPVNEEIQGALEELGGSLDPHVVAVHDVQLAGVGGVHEEMS